MVGAPLSIQRQIRLTSSVLARTLRVANSLQAPTDIDLKTSPLGLKDIGLIHTFNKIILVIVWIHSGVTYMLAMVIE